MEIYFLIAHARRCAKEGTPCLSDPVGSTAGVKLDENLRKKFDVSVKLNVRGSGTKDTARFTIKPTLVRACSAVPIVLGTQRASDCLGVPFFCLNAERQLYEDGEVIDQLLLIDAQGNGKTIGTNQVLKLQYGINAVSSKHTGNK